jgi:CheY-like chemotaxis protein
VVLQPATAQALALALHELATNAAKYGALSSVSGKLSLLWELKAGKLHLEWNETGGPSASQPTSQGFGTRIILASIEGQLGGQVRFDWRAGGLQCALSVPLSDMSTSPDHAGNGGENECKDHGSAESNSLIAGHRIMIVEDEALVAISMSDLMTEFGFAVVGPFGKLKDATTALKKGGVDAAILDINLGGELVYSLADSLAAKNVPFVFVTGYGTESIDRRFANIRVMQKPVDRQMLEHVFLRSGSGAFGEKRSSANDADDSRAVAP